MSPIFPAAARPPGWAPPWLLFEMPNCAPAPEIVANAIGLEKLIEHADLVITAEGRIDEQNLTRKDTVRSDWADIDSIPTLRNA
jgi:glycerate kinase